MVERARPAAFERHDVEARQILDMDMGVEVETQAQIAGRPRRRDGLEHPGHLSISAAIAPDHRGTDDHAPDAGARRGSNDTLALHPDAGPDFRFQRTVPREAFLV